MIKFHVTHASGAEEYNIDFDTLENFLKWISGLDTPVIVSQEYLEWPKA